MTLMELVDELEQLIQTASSIPLTGKTMIEKEEVLEIIRDIKAELPSEIKEAQQISTDRDQIITGAHEEADRIMAAARAHAEEMIREDELVLKANERAEEILSSAQRESTQIREGDRDYADELLERTQVNLSDMIKTINENRQELRG